jgi:ribonuclease III
VKAFHIFEEKINVRFNNPDLLEQAFVHRSYLNENKDIKREHNERLEFLGDAVLELVITHFLYEKFPHKPEGELTALRSALVNAVTLSQVAQKLEVNTYLLLSKGEAKDTGRARAYILADALEAIIGAIYLDQGYDAAQRFIYTHITTLLDEILAKELWIDAKSKFQEIAQDEVGITPSYKVVKETGPDHDKHFTVMVCLGAKEIAQGTGKSKQEAEQDAAREALKVEKWK